MGFGRFFFEICFYVDAKISKFWSFFVWRWPLLNWVVFSHLIKSITERKKLCVIHLKRKMFRFSHTSKRAMYQQINSISQSKSDSQILSQSLALSAFLVFPFIQQPHLKYSKGSKRITYLYSDIVVHWINEMESEFRK